MVDTDKKLSTVEIAKQRYRRAVDAFGVLRQQAIADTKFVMGDSENQWQWPEDVYQNRSAMSGKPCLTINITAQHCNQIINSIRQNRPSAKISPVDGDGDKKTAVILGGMLRSIQSYSNADTAHDTAAEHSVYGGEGYWRVLTEYESPESFDQVITIKTIVNPQLVLIDPDAVEPDRSDAKWAFIFDELSPDQVHEEYPDMDVSSWVEDEGNGWTGKNTIRRAEYFWCEFVDDTLIKLMDGTTELKSKLPEGSVIKGDALILPDGSFVQIAAKRETTRKVWYWCKLLGGESEPIDKRIWPGQYMPIITVVGKEVNVNGEIVRKGVVRDLKDSGRMVNYSYSAAVETVALQNKVPYLASAESIAGFEDIWGSANIENRAYLPYNERDVEGQPLQMPSRQAPATMASAQVQMLQLSVEQMRASSGQQNANFGIRSEAQSGVGIQRLKAQGEIATFHFPDNLARALRYEAKVILDLIPKIYDTKRVIRILGLDGKETSALLDPEMGQAYTDEIQGDVDAAFNPMVGRYDVAIDTGPSYQTQRQEAADALTSLTQSMPNLSAVAGDLVVKSYDFPMADEISERLAKALPPGLRDDKEGSEMSPQHQQVMQQLDQKMQMMDQQMHAAADAIEQKDREIAALQVKAQQEEMKRMSVQLDLEKTQALQEIENAQEMPDNSAEIEAIKSQQAAQVEQAKALIVQETELRKTEMETAAQIEIARINHSAMMPKEGVNETMAMMAQLMANHGELMAHVSKPKSAQVRIIKQADGSFVGEKIEKDA